MTPVNNILLGKIAKTNGFEGAVTVRTETAFAENIPEMETVFLEIEGRPVPFFIEYCEQLRPGLFRMKFEGYDTAEKVEEFAGCSIFLSGTVSAPEKSTEIFNPVGFRVYSKEKKLIGTITGIIRNPSQWIFRVTPPGKGEILIPVHEDLILGIDEKNAVITMIIPEGLTEIN